MLSIALVACCLVHLCSKVKVAAKLSEHKLLDRLQESC
jgi:hypothetical protein